METLNSHLGEDLTATNDVVTSQQPIFKVELAVQALEAIRGEATEHEAQFAVPGRKAMLDLMWRVYLQYHSAKGSGQFELFMNNIRAKLTLLNIEYRKSSPETSLLIRYVFEGFDDKQVHVYGRSLAVAFALGKLPTEFSAFVNNTKGAFEGIRGSASATATPKPGTPTPAIALSEAENEITVDTVAISDWLEGEKYRVFIAVRNEDDQADIKDAKLSPEIREKTLLLYLANKKALVKDGAQPTTKAEQDTILQAELALQEARVRHQNALAELEKARAVNDVARENTLRPRVAWLAVQQKAFEAAVKDLKKGVTASATA
jgi:hypothetical protein